MKSFALLAIVATMAFSPVAASAKSDNCGGASWYSSHRKTASGERMQSTAMTAAHRSYGFGTQLMVVNKRNGKSVVVRINDRGPFTHGRVLDLSKSAAQKIDLVASGTAQVCYTVVASK